jgi:outer membrane lipoprotein-sorting protein
MTRNSPAALTLTVSLAACCAISAPAAAQAPSDLPACPTTQETPDPAQLVRRIERTIEGRSAISTMTMSIRTKAWSRRLRMKTWSEGRDYALIRVLEGGPRETGLLTLKREKQLWNYLPRAGRIMKLPSGMLGDSWLGSDFTNDDLVRGNSIVDDFETALAGTTTHEGRNAWRVTLTPRPTAAVVWGRIEMLVDRAVCVPLVERFYDEEGLLARTMTFSDIRTIGWRHFPARVTVVPEDSARETMISYEEIEFDVVIPDDTFSLHRLQQGR